MTNDGRGRPLAKIVGQRLRTFREQKQLRQEDVANAARSVGLPWGRSSVASLERGNREISVEELLLLPLIIRALGGWNEPLIPVSEKIQINETMLMMANNLADSILSLISPTAFTHQSPEHDLVQLGALAKHQNLNDFQAKQVTARHFTVFEYILLNLWPDTDYLAWIRNLPTARDEVTRAVASRLRTPDGDPVVATLVHTFAIGLWGHSVGDERDARAVARGRYESRRALQSARGHVTRELIEELRRAIEERWNEVQTVFNELEEVIKDEAALDAWEERLQYLKSKSQRK